MSSKVESCDIDMDVDDTVPASSSSSSSSSSANLLPAKRQSSVKESSQVNVTRNELGEVVDVNDYHIVKELGTGAFATVYLCSTSSSAAADAAAAAESGERLSASYELYAVKVIEKSILKRKRTMTRANGRMTFKTAFDKVEEEVAVMKKLNHDNLVLLHEVIDDEEDDSMFMVLEYVQGGCVLDWDEESRTFYGKLGDGPGGLFSESAASSLCLDILHGLEYLHLHHIAHRDLKPENVLLATRPGDGTIVAKIADFGVSHYFEDEEEKEFRSMNVLSRSESRGQLGKTEGTYYFWAPEMCDRGGNYNGYATDLWALGICAHCLLFGTLPFEGSDPLDLFENIRTTKLVLPPKERYPVGEVNQKLIEQGRREEALALGPHKVSKSAAAFIYGLLEKDPKKRLTLEDAITSQPFVANAPPWHKQQPQQTATAAAGGHSGAQSASSSHGRGGGFGTYFLRGKSNRAVTGSTKVSSTSSSSSSSSPSGAPGGAAALEAMSARSSDAAATKKVAIGRQRSLGPADRVQVSLEDIDNAFGGGGGKGGRRGGGGRGMTIGVVNLRQSDGTVVASSSSPSMQWLKQRQRQRQQEAEEGQGLDASRGSLSNAAASGGKVATGKRTNACCVM